MKPNPPATTIVIDRPRCTACRSLDVKTYCTVKDDSTTVLTRYAKCRACGMKLKIICR